MEQSVLEIRNLHANVENQEILKGVDLTIRQGEIHALLGPNGAGKSTLGYAITGHPKYEITEGQVFLDGEELLEMEPDERARKGLFLAFQYPVSIPGVTVANFLRMAINSRRGEEQGKISPVEFRRLLLNKMSQLNIDKTFAGRYLNEGFSGGEKKRAEILQLAVLEPKIAILDETDSGLDIDAMRIVADGVSQLLGPQMGLLVVTHYQRFLNYIKPDFVHVMLDGRIVASGTAELAEQVDEKGYEWVRETYAQKEMA
ncbi:MAG TPA: Fe-S cluster assembly ATPase SufC [Ardenticatenaceae bacterium]|nr:Fe-S cluster assembly ATPase SufC [Ardenticatenaceae bacterium]